MTPRELERAISVLRPAGERAPARADLAELMRKFPDTSLQEKRHG